MFWMIWQQKKHISVEYLDHQWVAFLVKAVQVLLHTKVRLTFLFEWFEW